MENEIDFKKQTEEQCKLVRDKIKKMYPFLDEPDYCEFQWYGLRCIVKRMPLLMTVNGYVGVPKTWIEEGLQNHVHPYKGLTYSDPSNDNVGGAWDTDTHFLGFDTAHAGDYIPWTPGPYIHSGIMHEETYRSFDWVTKSTKEFARAIAEFRAGKSLPDAP